MREGISPARLRTLQQQLGALRLNLIDKRLREIFPAQAHVPLEVCVWPLLATLPSCPPYVIVHCLCQAGSVTALKSPMG